MNGVAAYASSLNVKDWIAIVAVLIAAVSLSFNAANYLAGHRERKLRTYENTPLIKSTINAKGYKEGWRSVQLHLVPAADNQQNFSYGNWRIERVRLLWPVSAVLARAENDDYAKGVFYPEDPVRTLEGKVEGRPQRFALEFFIKFRGDEDRGRKAKFRVIFSHVNGQKRHTTRVWATLSINAEPVMLDATPRAGGE
jgi:hypothetical protein